jgi:neutral trehalase
MTRLFVPGASMGDFLLKTQTTDTRWFGAVSTLLANPQYAASVDDAGFQAAIDTLVANTRSGGVPASLSTSGQQWDYPNAWSPVQFFSMQALELAATKLQKPEYHTEAISIAQTWITTTYCAFLSTNALYEKYNVSAPGAAGHGGEYVVQTGFGWTNGLILWILDTYAADLTTPTC